LGKWQQPLDKFKLGPAFGVVDSWHPNGHRGTDYNGFAGGTPLKAVNDGEIVLNRFSKILGNVTVLKVGKHYFGYCHMSKPSALKVGTKVKAGDVIGLAGTTGSASSGVHLHLTLSLLLEGVFGGKVYDAYAFIEKCKASDKLKVAAKAAPSTPVAPIKHCATCMCKG
jgi:murein DD-endopeptidase MepM/ murein hydrolase activator NlpD